MNPEKSIAYKNLSDVTVRTQVRVPLHEYQVEAELFTFHHLPDQMEHLVLCFGNWQQQPSPWVRLHSECLTGDVFGSARCDCGPQLKESIELLKLEGGILLYMRQEGRGIGLYSKLDAYTLQGRGMDTYEANEALSFSADDRDYSSAAQMLKALDVGQIKLFSNNPDKVSQLVKFGIQVVEQRPTSTFENIHNKHYLLAKKLKTQHKLEVK